MSDNKILDAVRQLDVNNDNHWTTDGLPRLDTVRLLAGDGAISREAVETAAPDFKRSSAATYGLQGAGAAGNGSGAEGTGMPDQSVRDAATPPTAPSADALRGADNATLLAQASEPGLGNLNADGGPSNGPSVPDDVQAAAAAGAATPPAPPEITHGTTGLGFNSLATPASNAFDAAISTAHGPTTPPELGGPGSREAAAPGGLTADTPTDQGAVLSEGQAQQSAVEHGSAGNPAAVEALEAQLEAVSARTARLMRKADDAAAALATSVAEETALRNAIADARPRGGTMPAIQAYFASQDQVAEQTAAARTALLESGLNIDALNRLVGAAPIDKAIADANKAAASGR